MEEEIKYNELIIKFLAGEVTDNQINTLKEWLEKDPANRKIFDEENELWQETGKSTGLYNFKTEKAWSELSEHLGIGAKRINKVVTLNKNNFIIFIAAASVIFLVAVGGLYLWLTEKRSTRQMVVTSTTVRTYEGEKAHIILADSTRVVMNSGSSLEYTTGYNIKKREVKLSGECFFDVRTDPEKPFIVKLGKMTVSATGTRFNVFSYQNESRIETTLEEGNLEVTVDGKDTVKISAGQQVVYFTKTSKTVVRDVPTETYTSWKENKLRFIDTPFEEVLRKIARKYNVTFEVRGHDLFDLKYTATFIDEPIEDVMYMLKNVSPITYKIYNRTKINDKHYLKPKIVVGKRNASI